MELGKQIRVACLMSVAVVVTGAWATMPGTSVVPGGMVACDSIPRDTAFEDSLHEVTVMGDSMKLAPVNDAIRQSLGRNPVPKVVSLGDLLNKVAPEAMDYVMHPFGFAERKTKKKRKKVQQILQDFDKAGAPDPFVLKLDSIVKAEGLRK